MLEISESKLSQIGMAEVLFKKRAAAKIQQTDTPTGESFSEQLYAQKQIEQQHLEKRTHEQREEKKRASKERAENRSLDDIHPEAFIASPTASQHQATPADKTEGQEDVAHKYEQNPNQTTSRSSTVDNQSRATAIDSNTENQSQPAHMNKTQETAAENNTQPTQAEQKNPEATKQHTHSTLSDPLRVKTPEAIQTPPLPQPSHPILVNLALNDNTTIDQTGIPAKLQGTHPQATPAHNPQSGQTGANLKAQLNPTHPQNPTTTEPPKGQDDPQPDQASAQTEETLGDLFKKAKNNSNTNHQHHSGKDDNPQNQRGLEQATTAIARNISNQARNDNLPITLQNLMNKFQTDPSLINNAGGDTAAPVNAMGKANILSQGTAIQNEHALTKAGHTLRASATLQDIPALITRAVSNKSEKLNIEITPPELGRVEVKLEYFSDGRVKAVVAAERIETYHILKSDQSTFIKQMQDAGIDQNNLELSFTFDNPSSGNAFNHASHENAEETPHKNTHGAPTKPTDQTTIEPPQRAYQHLTLKAGLDLRI